MPISLSCLSQSESSDVEAFAHGILSPSNSRYLFRPDEIVSLLLFLNLWLFLIVDKEFLNVLCVNNLLSIWQYSDHFKLCLHLQSLEIVLNIGIYTTKHAL